MVIYVYDSLVGDNAFMPYYRSKLNCDQYYDVYVAGCVLYGYFPIRHVNDPARSWSDVAWCVTGDHFLSEARFQ